MTVVVEIPVSGRTKRAIIEMAYEDCGLAGYVFERTDDEFASGLRKLNTLMGEWPWNTLKFNLPTYGQGELAEFSGLDDKYIHAVSQYLAMRLAANMGKSMPIEYMRTCNRSLMLLQSEAAVVPKIGFTQGTPKGQGHRQYYRREPFFPVDETG